ncbi:MAG: ABC transporter ATP-binding protein [Candidatus Heimdallarchaeota archaeon]
MLEVHNKGKSLGNFEIQKGIFSYAKNDWKYYLAGILAMFAGVQANLFQPLLIQKIIDEIIIEGNSDNFIIYTLGIFGIALIAGVFNYSNRYFNDKAAEKTIFNLRNVAFEKLQHQSLQYHNNQTTGQLITKVTSDMEIIKDYLRRNFRLGLNSIYYYVSIGLIIYFTQPRFLGVFLLLLPFLFGISLIYAKKTRPLFQQRRIEYGELSNLVQESIGSIETIRAYTKEDYELNNFEQKNKDYLDLYIKTEVIRRLTLPVAVLLVSIGSVAILYIGGLQIITSTSTNDGITIGQLIQFNLYMVQLTTPTRLLGNFIVGYTQVNVSGSRVLEIIYSESEIQEDENAETLVNPIGKLEFADVNFSYEANYLVLSDVSLTTIPGETIAILGATGSGKTTLIQLIPRFFDPTSGVIKIDDKDIRQFTLNSLRQTIGIVSQDTFLFSRSIRENISFGKPNATEMEIVSAAKAAKAHEYIMEFPDGYDTVIGERGITLSGGQQQRLSIARTLLINPKILILDDSTSSVDAQTESEIQQALETLLKNRTTIIITQKISSARLADMIYVMDYGKIVERGTHDKLNELQGLYYEIYKTQEDPKIREELMIILGRSSN